MSGESAGLTTHTLESTDGQVRIAMQGVAAGSIRVDEDGDYEIASPMDEGERSCVLMSGRRDAGHTLQQAVDHLFSGMLRHAVQHVEAGAAGGRPFVLADALYYTKQNERTIMGPGSEAALDFDRPTEALR